MSSVREISNDKGNKALTQSLIHSPTRLLSFALSLTSRHLFLSLITRARAALLTDLQGFPSLSISLNLYFRRLTFSSSILLRLPITDSTLVPEIRKYESIFQLDINYTIITITTTITNVSKITIIIITTTTITITTTSIITTIPLYPFR